MPCTACTTESKCDNLGLCQQHAHAQIPKQQPCVPGSSSCERHARGMGECMAGDCRPPKGADGVTAAPAPDQRARFESWAARELGIGNFDRTQDEEADYLNPDTNDLWRCWQEVRTDGVTAALAITHEQALAALEQACDGIKDVTVRLAIRDAFTDALGVNPSDGGQPK